MLFDQTIRQEMLPSTTSDRSMRFLPIQKLETISIFGSSIDNKMHKFLTKNATNLIRMHTNK